MLRCKENISEKILNIYLLVFIMKKLIKKIIIFFVPIELLEHAIFEFRSKLGRLLSSYIILSLNNNNYINLGCGNSYKVNFINVEFYGTKK